MELTLCEEDGVSAASDSGEMTAEVRHNAVELVEETTWLGVALVDGYRRLEVANAVAASVAWGRGRLGGDLRNLNGGRGCVWDGEASGGGTQHGGDARPEISNERHAEHGKEGEHGEAARGAFL